MCVLVIVPRGCVARSKQKHETAVIQIFLPRGKPWENHPWPFGLSLFSICGHRYDYAAGQNLNVIQTQSGEEDGPLFDNERANGTTYYYHPAKAKAKYCQVRKEKSRRALHGSSLAGRMTGAAQGFLRRGARCIVPIGIDAEYCSSCSVVTLFYPVPVQSFFSYGRQLSLLCDSRVLRCFFSSSRIYFYLQRTTASPVCGSSSLFSSRVFFPVLVIMCTRK